MNNFLKRFVRDEEGATMVEYAIMVGLIAIVSITIITTVGTDVKDIFTKVQAAIGPL